MQVQHLIHETNDCGQQSQKVQKAITVTTGNNSSCHIPTEAEDPSQKRAVKDLPYQEWNWAVEYLCAKNLIVTSFKFQLMKLVVVQRIVRVNSLDT